eukprot:TRINITY_DN5869_c1_g2_i1.p1 TRINITY_DN5869_c1_g2~~TRINITY_DN5869_c1_g2_i1.p1  ORF type:complete len:898 (+),score=293.24 TRINITY_DN5869_c1_g2_i1:125-2818(+)
MQAVEMATPEPEVRTDPAAAEPSEQEAAAAFEAAESAPPPEKRGKGKRGAYVKAPAKHIAHTMPYMADGQRRAVAQRHMPRNMVVHPKGFKVLAKRSAIERGLKSYFRLPVPMPVRTQVQLDSIRKQITIVSRGDKQGFDSNVGKSAADKLAKKKKKVKAGVLDGFKLLNTAMQANPLDVVEVSLSGADPPYRKVVADDMTFFENLEFVDVGENALRMEDFRNLPKLQELHLHCNGVCEVPEGVGADAFQNLDTLNLSYNVLTGRAVSALLSIAPLQRLDLSNNPILALPHDLSGLANLAQLALKKTGLDHTCFAALSTLPNLVEVNLSYNAITGWWIGAGVVDALGCPGPHGIMNGPAAKALFPKERARIAGDATAAAATTATSTRPGRKVRKQKPPRAPKRDSIQAVPSTADAALAPPSQGAGLGLAGLPPIAPEQQGLGGSTRTHPQPRRRGSKLSAAGRQGSPGEEMAVGAGAATLHDKSRSRPGSEHSKPSTAGGAPASAPAAPDAMEPALGAPPPTPDRVATASTTAAKGPGEAAPGEADARRGVFGAPGGAVCFPKLATVGLVGNPIEEPQALAGFLTLPALGRLVLWRTPLCRNGQYCQKVLASFAPFGVTVELDPADADDDDDAAAAAGDAVPKALTYTVPAGEMRVVQPFPPPPKLFRHRSQQNGYGEVLRVAERPAPPRPPEAIDEVPSPRAAAADTNSFFFITEADIEGGGADDAAPPLPPGVPNCQDILREADQEISRKLAVGMGAAKSTRKAPPAQPAAPQSLTAAFVELKRVLTKNASAPSSVAPAPKNTDARATARRRRGGHAATAAATHNYATGAPAAPPPLLPPPGARTHPQHVVGYQAAAQGPSASAKGIRLPPLGDASTPSSGMPSAPVTGGRRDGR